MGLFGGGNSDSRTTNSSNAEDNRVAAADRAIVAQGGSDVSVYDLSADALDDLLDGGVAAFEEAGSVVKSGVADATHLSERALDTVYDAQDRSLDSVDDAVHDSLDFAGLTVEESNETSRRALETVQDSTDDAFNFASDTQSRALSSIDEATAGIFDVVGQSLGVADTALSRAFASTPGGGVDVARDLAKYIVPVALIFGAVIMFRGMK